MKRRNFIVKSSLMTSIPLLFPLPWMHFDKESQNDGAKIQELLSSKEPNVWVFTGDSITHGAKHTHGYRSYPEVFQERIRYELWRPRDVVINTGISGHTTALVLADFDWRIAHFKPQVVSVMLGTNDCAKDDLPPEKFERNLIELVSKIRNIQAIPVLHTPNVIILEDSPKRQSLPEYVEVIRKVAQENSVILVDQFEFWEKSIRNSGAAKIYQSWLNDNLHPNGKGHQVMAQEMFRTLEIFDATAPTCGAPYYEGKH